MPGPLLQSAPRHLLFFRLMKTYGLVGHPLAHSFSSEYFTRKFRQASIDARYLNFDIPDISDLPRVIAADPTLQGFNVTIPYKQAVIRLLHTLDPVAEAIGAVNTVRVERTPRGIQLRGFNTDAPGFLGSLSDMAGGTLSGNALLLGSGGAAAAVRYALQSRGVACTVVSRMQGKADLTYADLDADLMAAHRFIINCTPVGTYPDSQLAPPLPYGLVTTSHICHDLVYNPGCTRFMALCAERGAAVRNGLDMLHRQAELAWNIWNTH